MSDDKRWSDSQEIGAIGEAAFEQFALRHGLTPNRASHDVGLDYFCQVASRDARAKRKIRHVTGAVVGVAVRTTTAPSGAVALTRADALALLDAQVPVGLALVHLVGDGRVPAIHFRFVDEALASRLHALLGQTPPEGRMLLRPNDLKPASAFAEDLGAARQPGFVERVRRNIAALTLSAAHSAHRDHPVRAIVIAGYGAS